MSVQEIVFHVTAAALAVIGFYGLLHGLFEAFFAPRQITAAVVLREAVPPEELDILLCEAHRAPFRRRRQGVVLVIPTELMAADPDGELTEAYAEVIRKYGVRVCPTDWTDAP